MPPRPRIQRPRRGGRHRAAPSRPTLLECLRHHWPIILCLALLLLILLTDTAAIAMISLVGQFLLAALRYHSRHGHRRGP